MSEKKQLKILLINPPYTIHSKGIKGSEWVTPPLGLAYLAAMVPEHEVRIVDMEQETEKIQNIIKKFKPDVVGLTSTTPTVNNSYWVIEKVKRIDKDIITLIGGCHVSVLPLEAIKKKGVDIVVKGEGEFTFKEIIDRISKDKYLKDIDGTVQKNGKKIIINKERALIKDLDSLPFPARHLLNYDSYKRPFTKGKKPVTIMTSRGCPHQCGYCNKGIFGSCFRPRSVGNILKEIELLAKEGYDDFHILDDTFSLLKPRAKEIFKGIIKLNLKLNFNIANGMRIDTLDEELASLMEKAGCYCIGFGIESGNQKTQDYIKKSLKLHDIEKGFKLIKKYKIDAVAFVIIGFPNETKEDIKQTITFLKRVRPDAVNFHVLIPLPGTRIYDELKRDGLLLEKNWSKYSFHNPPVYHTKHLTREEILKEYKNAYRSYHFSPRYILFRLWKMRDIGQLRNNFKGFMTLIRS